MVRDPAQANRPALISRPGNSPRTFASTRIAAHRSKNADTGHEYLAVVILRSQLRSTWSSKVWPASPTPLGLPSGPLWPPGPAELSQIGISPVFGRIRDERENRFGQRIPANYGAVRVATFDGVEHKLTELSLLVRCPTEGFDSFVSVSQPPRRGHRSRGQGSKTFDTMVNCLRG